MEGGALQSCVDCRTVGLYSPFCLRTPYASFCSVVSIQICLKSPPKTSTQVDGLCALSGRGLTGVPQGQGKLARLVTASYTSEAAALSFRAEQPLSLGRGNLFCSFKFSARARHPDSHGGRTPVSALQLELPQEPAELAWPLQS